MIRLHYFPPMCSLASMVALEMAEAAYEPVCQDMSGDRAALYSVSRLGQIPVLETDDGIVTDTVAIIYWLSERYPAAALLPKQPRDLVSALSKMGWLSSHLHIVRRRYAMPILFGAPVDAVEPMRAVARPIYWKGLQQVDTWIDHGDLGGAGAEAYALLFYHWAVMDRMPVDELRHFSGLATRLMENDGIRRALSLHASPLVTPSR